MNTSVLVAYLPQPTQDLRNARLSRLLLHNGQHIHLARCSRYLIPAVRMLVRCASSRSSSLFPPCTVSVMSSHTGRRYTKCSHHAGYLSTLIFLIDIHLVSLHRVLKDFRGVWFKACLLPLATLGVAVVKARQD